MAVSNPYGDDLGAEPPLDALAQTPVRIRQLVERWGDDHFEQSYADGKWSARRLLIHLAQTELALTTRARFALTEDRYAAQSFEQDRWLGLDEHTDARTALDAYVTLRKFNLEMWRRLTPEQLARPFTHPEHGALTVEWIMRQMAGHDLHHLKHFEAIR